MIVGVTETYAGTPPPEVLDPNKQFSAYCNLEALVVEAGEHYDGYASGRLDLVRPGPIPGQPPARITLLRHPGLVAIELPAAEDTPPSPEGHVGHVYSMVSSPRQAALRYDLTPNSVSWGGHSRTALKSYATRIAIVGRRMLQGTDTILDPSQPIQPVRPEEIINLFNWMTANAIQVVIPETA